MKLVLILTLSFFISGCDLFSTRPAEKPNLPRSNFQQAATPKLLIENLVNSLSDKSVQDYLACFSDPSFSTKKFIFIPSSSSVTQFPAGWTRSSEELYFNNLIPKISINNSISLIFSNENYSTQSDSVVYTASYSLNVPNQDPTLPKKYAGSLKFYMNTDSRGIWNIDYWQDYSQNNNDPTWSELKWRNY